MAVMSFNFSGLACSSTWPVGSPLRPEGAVVWLTSPWCTPFCSRPFRIHVQLQVPVLATSEVSFLQCRCAPFFAVAVGVHARDNYAHRYWWARKLWLLLLSLAARRPCSCTHIGACQQCLATLAFQLP